MPSPQRPSVALVLMVDAHSDDLLAALVNGTHAAAAIGARMTVVHSSKDTGRELGLRFPEVEWVLAAQTTPEPERRAVGFIASGGDIVVFARVADLLDHRWLEALVRRTALSGGGTVEASSEWTTILVRHGVAGALGDN